MTLGLPVEIQGHPALILAVFPIPHAFPHRAPLVYHLRSNAVVCTQF